MTEEEDRVASTTSVSDEATARVPRGVRIGDALTDSTALLALVGVLGVTSAGSDKLMAAIDRSDPPDAAPHEVVFRDLTLTVARDAGNGTTTSDAGATRSRWSSPTRTSATASMKGTSAAIPCLSILHAAAYR